MSKIIAYMCACLVITLSYGQDFDQLSERYQQILDLYKQQVSKFSEIQSCGHSFDGPASFAKQLERSSLDALFVVDDATEMEIGQKVFEEITKSETILTNHWAKPKIDRIFQSLIGHADREAITYKYYILDSEDINAFSTVGGHIYLCSGLIDFVDSMDELAFILGHEIAHIDLRHTIRKQKKLMLASSIGKFFDAEDLALFALNINLFLSAPFDQIDEYDADYQGYQFAQKAGYDVEKFTDFFEKLEDAEEKNLLVKLLSTHPFASDRKRCLESINN